VRILVAAGVLAIVAGLILAFSGSPVAGGLVFAGGIVLEGLAGLVSFIRGVTGAVKEWGPVLTGGVPSSVRVLSVTPPSSVIFSPEATVEVEVTGKDGQTATVERELPVPRLAALGWKLTNKSPFPTPERFDFERQLELELRREAEAQA
jgi:hypothetical protein